VVVFSKFQEVFFFLFCNIIHHLAAKTFIQTKDLCSKETPEKSKEDVFNVGIESGVTSSFTALFAINKETKQPLQLLLAFREILIPMLLGPICVMSKRGNVVSCHSHS
jgi:hypothetical protein